MEYMLGKSNVFKNKEQEDLNSVDFNEEDI